MTQELKTHTPVQLAFIEAIQGRKIPLIDNFLTINNYFNLDQDSGEFEHIDTHAAFLVFQAGYLACKAEGANAGSDNGVANHE